MPFEIDPAELKLLGMTEDELTSKLMQWWQEAYNMQQHWKAETQKDHDFYDGFQWDPEDVATLESRGQKALVFNKIKPSVDWITGTEKKTRVNWNVLPRSADDVDSANVKKQILKYLEDVNRITFKRSMAFCDAVKGGIGWTEPYADPDPMNELINYRYVDWRDVWYDPYAKDLLLVDTRFRVRGRWVDLDIAKKAFPDAADRITMYEDANLTNGLDDDELLPSPILDTPSTGIRSGYAVITDSRGLLFKRPRARMLEMWWKELLDVEVVRGAELGSMDGSIYEPDPWVDWMIEKGRARKVRSRQWVMFITILCGGRIVAHCRSPYHHNQFPMIPIIANMCSRDRAPYGVIRALRDPQVSLNKRHSTSLRILSTTQVVYEEGAVRDAQKAYDEVNRPDGFIAIAPGKRFDINRDNSLADQHVKLMDQAAQYIQDVAGVTDENMGRDTNAQSGKAIQARQEQGHVVTAGLFDSLRLAVQAEGEIMLSMVEQYLDQNKVIRITGEKDPEFLTLNQPTEVGGILNDITARKADFIVDIEDYSATTRRIMFENLLEMAGRMPPEISVRLLEPIVDMSDLPNREELIGRLREALNPPAPQQQAPDPEVQARADKLVADAELARAKAANLQAQDPEASARISKITADAELSKAKAESLKNDGDVKRLGQQIAGEKVKSDRVRVLGELQHKRMTHDLASNDAQFRQFESERNHGASEASSARTFESQQEKDKRDHEARMAELDVKKMQVKKGASPKPKTK